MPTFDRELLSATIDRNGIAWVSYAEPPYTLWQMVESDAVGTVKRRSSSDSQDVLEPIVRASDLVTGSCVSSIVAMVNRRLSRSRSSPSVSRWV